MSAEEAFSKVLGRQSGGVAFHHDLSRYFSFLSLHGFAELQRGRYEEEDSARWETERYYLATYHRLLTPDDARQVVISPIWAGHAQSELTLPDRQKAISDGFQMWSDWERKTRSLYSEVYHQLNVDGMVADALYVGRLVSDVNGELNEAEDWQLWLTNVGYDMPTIVEAQECLRKGKAGR